jgi:hypothetical protein
MFVIVPFERSRESDSDIALYARAHSVTGFHAS